MWPNCLSPPSEGTYGLLLASAGCLVGVCPIPRLIVPQQRPQVRRHPQRLGGGDQGSWPYVSGNMVLGKEACPNLEGMCEVAVKFMACCSWHHAICVTSSDFFEDLLLNFVIYRGGMSLAGRSTGSSGRLVPVHHILRNLRPVAHAPGAQQPPRQAADSPLRGVHDQL